MKSKCFPAFSAIVPVMESQPSLHACAQDCSSAARLYSKCYYTIYSRRYILYPVFQFHSARRHEVNQAKLVKFKARPLTVQLSTSITGRVVCLPACLGRLVPQKQQPRVGVSPIDFTLQVSTCSSQASCVKPSGISTVTARSVRIAASLSTGDARTCTPDRC